MNFSTLSDPPSQELFIGVSHFNFDSIELSDNVLFNLLVINQ
jgi:hypothetical protein